MKRANGPRSAGSGVERAVPFLTVGLAQLFVLAVGELPRSRTGTGDLLVAGALLGLAHAPGAVSRAEEGLWGLPRVVLGGLAGAAALPGLTAMVLASGAVLGLVPAGGERPGGAVPPALWVAAVALGPWAEERLYRAGLLEALCPVVGRGVAVVVGAASFAAVHPGGWDWLGTFVAGVLLGIVWVRTRSLAFCTGLHAGLNGAALLYGVPPGGHPVGSGFGVVAVVACLALRVPVGAGTGRTP